MNNDFLSGKSLELSRKIHQKFWQKSAIFLFFIESE